MTHPTISDDVIRDVLQRFPELAVHATEAENIEAIQRRYRAARQHLEAQAPPVLPEPVGPRLGRSRSERHLLLEALGLI
jgi:hypothetical protein